MKYPIVDYESVDFYHENFGFFYPFTVPEIHLHPRFNYLFPIVPSIDLSRIVKRVRDVKGDTMVDSFITDFSLIKSSRPKDVYWVLCEDTLEVRSQEYLGMSGYELRGKGFVGMTLEERLIFCLRSYHHPMDVFTKTLCIGSGDFEFPNGNIGGNIPFVYTQPKDGKLIIDIADPRSFKDKITGPRLVEIIPG